MRMRFVRFVSLGLLGLVALISAALIAFRRNPRMGSTFVNTVVNPVLIRRGLAGQGRAEIATLEHFGRRSGKRYLTPVHPEPAPDGFQIMVPLGVHSEWARNVIAAGHCRLQLHDVVYELDEPKTVKPCSVVGQPAVLRRIEESLGFAYLTLREFGSSPGSLEDVGSEAVSDAAPSAPEPEAPLAIS